MPNPPDVSHRDVEEDPGVPSPSFGPLTENQKTALLEFLAGVFLASQKDPKSRLGLPLGRMMLTEEVVTSSYLQAYVEYDQTFRIYLLRRK